MSDITSSVAADVPDAAAPLDLGHIMDTAAVAEAASLAAYVVLTETRGRLRRVEATLALVMTAFMALDDERAEFTRFRLAQELRRMAAIPAAAAQIAGCEDEDIDPALLTALASHVYGEASGTSWDHAAPPLTMVQ